MLVGLLHHPDAHHAPGDVAREISERTELPLGIVPHQVRGFLTHFSNIVTTCPAFASCVACSKGVVDAFAKDRDNFLLRVLNEPEYLESLTGITAMTEDIDLDLSDFALSDDDDDDCCL